MAVPSQRLPRRAMRRFAPAVGVSDSWFKDASGHKRDQE